MPDETSRRPVLWGGVECSLVRIGDTYRDELAETGHAGRPGDIDAIAGLGIRTLRYPVLWEAVSPHVPEDCDWRFADARLCRIRERGMTPIAGLLHHGSGPSYTSLADPAFPQLLARHAGRVAERYPWIPMYTPVNEPLTTARFSGLYGHWYPHRRNIRAFLRCLVNECLGTLLAMREIRKHRPDAQLVQTEDLGRTFSTPHLAYQASYENGRRWLSLDLLCGLVDARHPWYARLLQHGIQPGELAMLSTGEARPDIVGINYYATSERFLDEALHRYPACFHGRNPKEPYADVEAMRADLPAAELGAGLRLREAWERYRLPLAITEVHHGSTREEQVRWLAEVWEDAASLRAEGCDIRAVTVWSLFGAVDWNSLLTERRGFYEPGAFDIRSDPPRPTALAHAIRQIAEHGEVRHPMLDRPGWWRRDGRHFHPPARKSPAAHKPARTVLIAGGSGKLGRQLAEACALRGLDALSPPHGEMDITDPRQVEDAIRRHRPWAIINAAAAGQGRPATPQRIMAVNAQGAETLASLCARDGLAHLAFSADRVFDGSAERPYLEHDPVSPACFLGESKAEAERRVLAAHGGALVVRASPLFGPGDPPGALFPGRLAADDGALAATYTPDLARAALDLLLDGECGIWHLANGGTVLLDELLDMPPVRRGGPSAAPAIRLDSARGRIMPSLRDALARYRGHGAARRAVAPASAAAE